METFLIVCGGVITVGGAIAALNQWVIKPINEISKKLEKVDKLEEGLRVLMRAQAQTMEHLISGNNIDELRLHYEKLLDYCINN